MFCKVALLYTLYMGMTLVPSGQDKKMLQVCAAEVITGIIHQKHEEWNSLPTRMSDFNLSCAPELFINLFSSGS